jgi:hypothetical protein
MSTKPKHNPNQPVQREPLTEPELYIVVANVHHRTQSKPETRQHFVIANDGDKAVSLTRIHFANVYNVEPSTVDILTYVRCIGSEAFFMGTDGNEYNVRIGISIVGLTDPQEPTPSYVPNCLSPTKEP